MRSRRREKREAAKPLQHLQSSIIAVFICFVFALLMLRIDVDYSSDQAEGAAAPGKTTNAPVETILGPTWTKNRNRRPSANN
jgi:hypothetical protein